MLQGADDSVSSPQDAEALIHALAAGYTGEEQRLKVVVLPGVTHQWAQAPGLDEVRANVAQWLNRYG
jgi:hypothetical protein